MHRHTRGWWGLGGLLVLASAGCTDQAGSIVHIQVAEGTAIPGAAGAPLVGDAPVAYELFVGEALPTTEPGSDVAYHREFADTDVGTYTAGQLLDGFDLLLTSDVAVADRELVLVAWPPGADATLPERGDPVLFGAVAVGIDPGELRRYDLVLDARTNLDVATRPSDCRSSSLRRLDAVYVWGTPSANPAESDHCLRWNDVDGDGITPLLHLMTRVDDRDCDGHVPPGDDACAGSADPFQCDDFLDDLDPGLRDADGDGYIAAPDDPGYATMSCDRCRDAETGAVVACECSAPLDNLDAPDDALFHFNAPETCDGFDTNCNGLYDGDEPTGDPGACVAVEPGTNDCFAGRPGCHESEGDHDDHDDHGCARDARLSPVACTGNMQCGPSTCKADLSEAAVTCSLRTTQSGACEGRADIVPLVESASPDLINPDSGCTATLWGGDQAGWALVLAIPGVAGDPPTLAAGGTSLSALKCSEVKLVNNGDQVPDGPVAVLIELEPAGALPGQVALLPLHVQQLPVADCGADGDNHFSCVPVPAPVH